MANKDKNYLDVENYPNQEDFFRINNKGDNNIGLKSTNKIIDNNNNSISVTDSIDKTSDFKKNINNTNNNNYTISNSVQYNKNDENPYIEKIDDNFNDNNISNDVFMVEDNYINRKSNNYRSSINYLATFRNSNYNNRNNYKQEIKNENETERKLAVLTNRKSNGSKKRSMSSNNSNKNMSNIYNRNNSYKANIKSRSLRDIIMNNNKNIEKDNNNKNKFDIKKSGNDIHNNNIYIETPHFHMSQSSPLSSYNNNYNMENKDIFQNNLNLISSTIPRQVFSNRESYKDYFDLKKKIIVESSTLLHDERRMMNLANALNKKGSKNSNISSRVNYNYNKYIK